ncbi:MAG: beta-lactamase family protein [Acidimicrobiales bacterium]|nr:beta-lactamase family protein [Acidimicrobiales bacterium]
MDAARLGRIDAHFRRYVDEGRLPGWQLALTRGGKVVHLARHGHRDVEAGLPVEDDTVFRIYSMTKPVTSVATMLLYEEGLFELKDPVSRWIPSFADVRVFTGGTAENPATAPAAEPVRIWHLLTHTAGLTYGFHHVHATDEIYRNAGFDFGPPRGYDLEGCVDLWAGLPLVNEPGARFNYSHATDVLGRLVEVLAGVPLDQFLRERVFEPLGMHDTAFWADGDLTDRLGALYVPNPKDGTIFRYDPIGEAAKRAPSYLSGGGGLVSTTHDYLRFCEMLRRGGELDGARLLGPRTLAYMTTNHLPGGVDLEHFGQSTFAETAYDGVGFGLGFAVVIDPAAAKTPSSVGEFSWGGAASTGFWVDPVEDITAVFMTQLLPSSTYNLRAQFKQLVKQALID